MKKIIFSILMCLCICSCYPTYTATVNVNYDVAYNDSTFKYNKLFTYKFKYPGTGELKEYYKNPSKFANDKFEINSYSIAGTNYLDFIDTYHSRNKHIFSSTAHIRLNSYNIDIENKY